MNKVIPLFLALSALPGCSSTGLHAHSPINSTPLEERVPAQYKKGVAFVQDVRTFAIEHLGMQQDSKHYTWFSEEKQTEHRLYMLSVTNKTVLPSSRTAKSEELDKVSFYRAEVDDFLYLFSEVDTLEDERDYYTKKGYDTYWRTATDYHTIGSKEGSSITPDFLKSAPEDQAQTVIHEMCHEFVEKNIAKNFPTNLNESFCNLVGHTGAIDYFTAQNQPEGRTKAITDFEDHHSFAQKYVVAYQKLQQLYHSHLSQAEMLEKRAALLAESRDFMGDDVNNALLWSWHPYLFYYPMMETAYHAQGDNLPRLIQKMRHCPEDKEKAFKYIVSLTK